jgi:hypothetical protein
MYLSNRIISTSSTILSLCGVVCAASDLKRIKTGESSEKGRVFDIVKIFCGSIGLAIRLIAMSPIVLTLILKI